MAVPGVEVVDLALGGKSRSWTRLVQDIAHRDAQILIFADADTLIPEGDALSRLVQGLIARPGLFALSSQPVKDLTQSPGTPTLTERLIAASAWGLDDRQVAICGQLYAMPAARAWQVHLPIGLPVEDGLLRAMLLTDHLTGAVGVRHIYASERRLTPQSTAEFGRTAAKLRRKCGKVPKGLTITECHEIGF